MKRFDPRAAGDAVTVSLDMTDLIPSGATITGYSVSASVFAGCPVPDPSPSATLDGLPGLQGNVLLQRLTGGGNGCTYVLTFKLTFSTGDSIEEDVLQLVSQYVPV